MNKEAMITRSEEAVSAEVDGTAVMMSVNSGKYFGLDEIATKIWDLLEEPKDVNTICNELLNEYEIDEESCRKDVDNFLTQLLEEKLITIS